MEFIADNTQRELGRRNHCCRICSSRGDFSSYLVREMMYGSREEFEYFVCDDCGCLQIAQIPDDMGKYYADTYYSFNKVEYNEEILRTGTKTKQERILDVGCGSGKWLMEMAQKGYTDLWGCDPFVEGDMNYGDIIHIQKCSIHEIEGANVYDIIHMGDSLEHMEDPVSAMGKASSLLKDNGVILIHVPIFPNVIFDMYGAHWYQLDAPRHLHIPAERTLKYIASQSGLYISGMEYDAGMLSVLFSWFYQQGICHKEITDELLLSTFSRDRMEEIQEMCKEANRLRYGDSAGFVLRKDIN